MSASEPQDPGQSAPSVGGKADEAGVGLRALGPSGGPAVPTEDRPTLGYTPASSGIGAALGQEIAVVADPEDFIHELTQSGLLEPTEAVEYRRRFSEAGDLRDARAVSRELVRAGRLTPYQAAAVLQGKTRGLFIGGYLVLDRLGAGSMGIVLKAEHRRLRRVVALKLLPPSLARNPSSVARFHREATAAARLSHPNVVSVLDADEFRGLHFLVMEYVQGTDLARLVRERGPMDVARAIDCIIQASRGLRATDEAGVVHRDIKPSNLLLEPGGTLKILDLGVARLGIAEGPLGAAGADASLTESNVLVGTVDYMAPEQATNPKVADLRSDIYSLGCTLHYLLTGRPPYHGETVMERLLAHRERPIPRLTETRPDVPPSLDGLFERMLSKSPEGRVSSLDELIAGLESCLADQAAGLRAAPPPPSPPDPGISKSPPSADTSGRARPSPVIEAIRSSLAGRSRAIWLAGAGLVAAAVLAGIALRLAGRRPEAARSPDLRVAENRPSANPVRESEAPRDKATLPPTGTSPVNHLEGAHREATAPKEVKPEDTPLDRTHPEAGAVEAIHTEVAKAPRRAVPVGLIGELRGHQGRVNAVAVSADGSRALSGGQDRSVRLWDLDRRTPLLRLDHDGPVTSVGITPDGRVGISGSLDRTVRVWDLRPDRSPGMRRLVGHTGPVFAVGFSPDRRLVLSGGGDRTIRVWDLQTGLPEGQPLMHESAVVAMAVATGGMILAGCEDGTLCQWDLASRQVVRRLASSWPVLCVALSADGHRALSGHPDGDLVLWDLDLGVEIGRMADHGDYVRAASFTPDGRGGLAGSQRGMLLLWDLQGRRVTHRFRRPSELAGQMELAVFEGGRLALTAETDGLIRLWGLPPIADAKDDAVAVPVGRR